MGRTAGTKKLVNPRAIIGDCKIEHVENLTVLELVSVLNPETNLKKLVFINIIGNNASFDEFKGFENVEETAGQLLISGLKEIRVINDLIEEDNVENVEGETVEGETVEGETVEGEEKHNRRKKKDN